MIQIRKKPDCCGCGACLNICPKSCIKMSRDNEGFLYPKVETDKCINCGLCEKSCPIALVNKNWTRKSKNWTLKNSWRTALSKGSTSGPPPLDRT